MKHRSFSFITGVMLVTTLTGCSLVPYETNNTAELAEPMATIEAADKAHESNDPNESIDSDAPAFHFASGDLPLGDFDYEAIKDNLFDPCKEISAEEFAAVGFSTVGSQSLSDGGKVGCGLVGGDVHKGYAVGSTPVTRDQLERDEGAIISRSASGIVPGLLTYQGVGATGFSCVAAVDTVRGQFSVAVNQDFEPRSFDALCESAVQIMEDLYRI